MTSNGKVPRADVIGSLLRPSWLAEARQKWEAGDMPAADFKKIEDRAVDEAIKLQEDAGLDVVTDGEMRRFTFFDQFTAALEGVDHTEGEAVPFHSQPDKVDIDFHSPVSVTGKVKRKRMLTLEEFAYARARASKPIKITLPSPLMFFTMWSPTASPAAYSDPFELFADGVDLVREEAKALADIGCEYIQIDAPDFGQLVEDSERERWEKLGIPVERVMSEGVEMLNAVADVPGVRFALHLCKGNFQSLWISAGGYEEISKHVFKGTPNFDVYMLEYDDERSGGFEPLEDLPDDKTVVLGLVTTKFDELESVDDLKARVDEAAKHYPREQLALSTQCGFASVAMGNQISEDAQQKKLQRVAEAAGAIWS
ncbi:MAG TPA: cobalamin-independent methionine synthase II family protein [Thermoleophilaceae bacterium]|nr:cobalamin-independent methionine synthase II family protein [Thermoleophilaceae bacterium]